MCVREVYILPLSMIFLLNCGAVTEVRGRCGRNRMVVGFITTCASSV